MADDLDSVVTPECDERRPKRALKYPFGGHITPQEAALLDKIRQRNKDDEGMNA